MSGSSNSHNGYSSKTVKTEDGQFELSTPRHCDGSFEPQLFKKQQTRFNSMDGKILSLYVKGMTTREVVAIFRCTTRMSRLGWSLVSPMR